MCTTPLKNDPRLFLEIQMPFFWILLVSSWKLRKTSLPKTEQKKRKTLDASCRLRRLMISLIHHRNSATTLQWFDRKPSKNRHWIQQPNCIELHPIFFFTRKWWRYWTGNSGLVRWKFRQVEDQLGDVLFAAPTPRQLDEDVFLDQRFCLFGQVSSG